MHTDPPPLRPLWVRPPRATRLNRLQRAGLEPYEVSIALSRQVTEAEAELLAEQGHHAEGTTLLIRHTTLPEIQGSQEELVRLLDAVRVEAVSRSREIGQVQDTLDKLAGQITFGGVGPVHRREGAAARHSQYEKCGHPLGECTCEP